MKTILTILLCLSVTVITAQNDKKIEKHKVTSVSIIKMQPLIISGVTIKSALAISAKGIKKIEEIVVEDLSKNTFLDLMLLRKTKKIFC